MSISSATLNFTFILSSTSKNIFWLTSSRVAALLLLLFAYTRLLPYLGPFGSGQYTFVQSYVLIFATVVDFGIQQFITKKISEQPEQAKQYFQSFFAFETVGALTLYILLVVVASFRHYDHAVFLAIMVAGLGMVANALTYPYLAVMAAYRDLGRVAFINFLNSLVNICMMLAAVYFHKYIVFLSAITLIFGMIDLVLYRVFVRRHLPQPDVLRGIFGLRFSLLRDILRQGWPFALLVGFSAIYNRIDVVIITLMKGYVQTGLYTAAYKVFDLLGFFPSVVSYTLFPVFAALMAKTALPEVRGHLEKYLRLMVAAAFPMAVGGSVLSQKLILLLSNGDTRFLPAANVLAILIWAPAILFIYIPVNSLVISQLTKKAVAVTGLNVVINIAGNLLLIPHLGIRAAAAMTVLSEFLQGAFYFYFVRKSITHFAFSEFLLKPGFAAIVMAAALWPLRFHTLLLTLPLGAGIYGFMLMVTRFFTKADMLTVKNLIGSGNAQSRP